MTEEKATEVATPSLVESALAETHAKLGTTLFDMTEEYEVLLAAAEEVAAAGEGEIPEEIFDRLEELDEEIEQKLENYIGLYKNLKMKKSMKEAVAGGLRLSIQPILDEIDRYNQQANAIEREMEKLRDRLGDRLEDLARTDPGNFRKKLTKKEKEEGKEQGNPHFKCEAGTTWVQDNPPGIILLVEPNEVPERFLHVPKEEWVNKGLLKEVLENSNDPLHDEAAEIASVDQTRGGRIR